MKRPSGKNIILLIIVVSLIGVGARTVYKFEKDDARILNRTELLTDDKMHLSLSIPGVRSVRLENRKGTLRYVVTTDDGEKTYLPQDFARMLLESRPPRPIWQRLLNVTSWFGVIWVLVGFFGQVVFTGRMVVQWWQSEKKGESIVPPSFWWMSLVGASMLLAYFVWRKDIIGCLGQGTGWLIYIRNLWLIYTRQPRQPKITDDPGPEPELER